MHGKVGIASKISSGIVVWVSCSVVLLGDILNCAMKCLEELIEVIILWVILQGDPYKMLTAR